MIYIYLIIKEVKKMRNIIFGIIGSVLIIFSGASHATVYVDGYWKSNGTYVQPHTRSNPNGTTWDNYGNWR